MDYSKLVPLAVARMTYSQLVQFRDQLKIQLEAVESRLSQLSDEDSGVG